MDWQLEAAEVRVLGALMEKEVATPEYYPLSLNALMNACNQKSNRDPVVSFDEETVEQALEGLRYKGLATRISGRDVRVPKHGQSFTEKYQSGPARSRADLPAAVARPADSRGTAQPQRPPLHFR